MADEQQPAPPLHASMNFKDALAATLQHMDSGTGTIPPHATLDDALASVAKDFEAEGRQPAIQTPATSPSTFGVSPEEGAAIDQNVKQVGGVLSSVGVGAAQAAFEAKDFIFGEPGPGDKSAIRSWIERKGKDLKSESVVNGIAQSVTQFGVGFIGLGKIKYVAQGAAWLGGAMKGGRFVADTARGAAAGGIFMDPHEERLSNLVEQYPALRNPITNYLAARPEDSAAEGRMKNALEGVVMDAALASALSLVAKGIKLYRAGDVKGANTVSTKADAAFEKAAQAASDENTGRAAALRREMEGGTDPLGDEFPGGLSPESAGSSLEGAAKGVGDASPLEGNRNTGAGSTAVGPGPDRGLPQAEGGGANGAASTRTSADALTPGSGEITARHGGDGQPEPTNQGGVAPSTGGERQHERSGSTGGNVIGDGQAPRPTHEDVAASLARLAEDNNAIRQYGSRDDAIEAGYRFASPRDAGIIPWQKLRTTEETRAWMDQLIEQRSAHINTVRGGNAKGIQSDKAVEAMVVQRAADWKEDPAELFGALKMAGDGAPQLAANMETSFLIANRAYQDAYDLAVRINAENYTGFGSRGEALAALQQRVAMATTMYANGKAIVSNSARTMRRMRGEFRITDQQLANIHASDPESLKDLIAGTGGNARALAEAGQLSTVRRITDEVATLQAANLLWGWKTQVINFATSAAQLLWRPLEVNLGAAVLKRTALRGDEAAMVQADNLRRQSVREVTYLGSVLSDGWHAAVRAWIDGDSALIPHSQEAFTLGAGGGTSKHISEIVPAYREIKSIDDLAFNALESWTTLKTATGVSLRTLGAADEMVKTMRYRAIVMSKASLEAENRGLVAGSREYGGFIAKRLDDSFDDLGRGVDRDALNEAKASTFQQDLPTNEQTWVGSLSRMYSSGVTQAPLLRLITPFIKTPTNLMRYGVKLTPGVNLLQREYTHALSGQAGLEAQARATGQMTLGLMLTSTALSLYASGRLVGAGPQNPEQKRQWLAQGNRPNSLTWTDDDGVKQFLELNRYDPINMPFLIVADAASIMTSGHLREEEEAGLTMSIVLSLSHIIRDKTYLRGISDAVQAFTDDRKLSAFPRRFAPGFLPFSSLMSSVNPDPVMHEVRSVTEALMAKVPGLSATLPPQRDFLGDVVLAPTGFASAQQNSGPLMRELDQMFAVTGTYLSPPAARGASTGGVDLRDITLKKNGRSAYDTYQELAGHPPGAPSLKDTLTRVVEDKQFQALPHGPSMVNGTRESAVTDVVMKYRQGAWQKMLAEHDDLREAVYKQRLDVGKAITEGRKSLKAAAAEPAMDRINGFLKSYGLGSIPKASVPQAGGD